MSRRTGRGGRPRHPEHRGGPRPHDPTRPGRPSATAPATNEAPGAPLVDVPFADDSGSSGGEPSEMAVGLGSGHRAASVSVDGGAGSLDAIRSGGPSILAGLNGDGPDRGAPELVPTEVAHGADLPVAIVHGGSDTGPAPFNSERHVGCTTAQLRRFIKSRAYVPMHEIRRRFLISSEDDEVAGIDVEAGRIFVGLPEREGQMLGELLRAGEIGYELQLDPVTPVVVGVYPMRPVTRG